MRIDMRHRALAALLTAVLALSAASPALARDALDGTLDGRAAGEQYPTGAFGWSFTWGFLAGLIGAGVSVGYYATKTASLDTASAVRLSDNEPTEYRLSYIGAYEKAAHGKMLQLSLLGGGLGWLTGLVLVSATTASSYGARTATAPVMAVSW